jgi:hypothetical protein
LSSLRSQEKSLFSENGISRPKLLQTPHHFSPGSIFTEHTSATATEAAATAKNKTILFIPKSFLGNKSSINKLRRT